MKNYWLDKKEKKVAKELWDDVMGIMPPRKNILTRYGKKRQAANAAIDAVKCTSKVCSKHSMNAKYLQEAKDCAERWGKTGLLDGIKNKWDKSVTAVLLEGQRLMNEQKYSVSVRTSKTEHRHGFNTEEDLFSFLDMVIEDAKKTDKYFSGGPDHPKNAFLVFKGKAPDEYDCLTNSLMSHEILVTVTENIVDNDGWHSTILCPGSWPSYDEHRRQAVKK